jgi:hypothetical protein
MLLTSCFVASIDWSVVAAVEGGDLERLGLAGLKLGRFDQLTPGVDRKRVLSRPIVRDAECQVLPGGRVDHLGLDRELGE